MLPPFLRSSYERYKTDTKTFATWTVNAAKKRGYERGLDGSMPSATRNDDKSSRSKKGHQTTISELRAVADFIAKSDVQVPSQVLDIARRAISLRKRVTSWFLGRSSNSSTSRHAHFVTVLEQICETLEWNLTKNSARSGHKTSATTPPGDNGTDVDLWLNSFAVLSFDESLDDSSAQTTPQRELVSEVEIVDDDQDDGEEEELCQRYFKAYCLFSDLHSMRSFISQTWQEYRDGKLDLMNATVITDAALQLAQDLIDEAVSSWPDLHNDSSVLQNVVFAMACMSRKGSMEPSLELGLPYNKDLADVADWIYLPTKVLLESFADVLQSNSIPVYKKNHFGTYKPDSDRNRMTTSQKFNEDKIILLDLLPEFVVVRRFGVALPVQDEITGGLLGYCSTKQVSLWLSFAVQIFLDIHHAMRCCRLSAFGDFRMSGLRVKRVITDFWKLSASHSKPAFWPPEGDQEIKNIHDFLLRWIEEDDLMVVRQEAHRALANGVEDHDKHKLLNQHPLLCGVIMLHINFRMQTIGQELLNQWYDVQQLSFLHNLVLKATPVSVSWPDMDAFIKIHAENRVFVGCRPKDAAESLKRLELATGISSASQFARGGRRPNSYELPQGKARRLEPTTAVFNLFRNRYMKGEMTRTVGIANIDKVLDGLTKNASSSSKSNGRARMIPDDALRRKWSNTHTLGILQVLATLKTKLFDEEPVLLFNYFGMHRRSLEVLRLIRTKEHAKFVQYFTEGYLPDDTFLGSLVMLIHHVARGSAEANSRLGLVAGEQATSRIVLSCGEVMKAYLEKNGDVACKELRVFCRNKTSLVDDEHGKRNDKDFVYWFCMEDVLDPKHLASLTTGIPGA
ncbi:hypothetical protein C1H76_7545 [Elsinoe australis]|uniref:DUF6604 domain-containing protein n=1 Tax=Elsinoe australis TaxID=40998 RepID=A0A4V6DUP5_9PEZI|nr:hypothetical protein C1H76_7545 [Elsinoe australis]